MTGKRYLSPSLRHVFSRNHGVAADQRSERSPRRAHPAEGLLTFWTVQRTFFNSVCARLVARRNKKNPSRTDSFCVSLSAREGNSSFLCVADISRCEVRRGKAVISHTVLQFYTVGCRQCLQRHQFITTVDQFRNDRLTCLHRRLIYIVH